MHQGNWKITKSRVIKDCDDLNRRDIYISLYIYSDTDDNDDDDVLYREYSITEVALDIAELFGGRREVVVVVVR